MDQKRLGFIQHSFYEFVIDNQRYQYYQNFFKVLHTKKV
jgi:hypothetical protein